MSTNQGTTRATDIEILIRVATLLVTRKNEDPDDPEVRAAYEAYTNNDPTKAQELFLANEKTQALRATSNLNSATTFARLQARMNEGKDSATAVAAWKRVVEYEKGKPEDWLSYGDQLIATGALSEATKAYAEASRLARAAPVSPGQQQTVAISFERNCSVNSSNGYLGRQDYLCTQALAILKPLAETDRENDQLQHTLGLILLGIGDAERARGFLSEALARYREALAIALAGSEKNSANRQWKHYLATSFGRIGAIQQAQGEVTSGLASYQIALEIAQSFGSGDTSSYRSHDILWSSLNAVGNFQLDMGELNDARTSYEKALQNAQERTKADSTNRNWQRDLASSLIRIGDLYRAQNDPVSALTKYQEALVIFKRLTEDQPTNRQWQSSLAVSYIAIGNAQLDRDDRPSALVNYRKGLGIVDAQFQPGRLEGFGIFAPAPPGFGIPGQYIGTRAYKDWFARLSLTDPAAAIKGAKFFLKAAELNSGHDKNARAGLFLLYLKLGELEQAQGDLTGAYANYRQAWGIGEMLKGGDPYDDRSSRYSRMSMP